MSEVFALTDELGPAKVVHVHNPALGLRAILVIDNVAAGPAIGGLRMAPDVSLSECVRLARAMTLKNAMAGLAHGGAKSVLAADARLPRAQKEALIRAFAAALRTESHYIFGPDMGTDETCMAWIKDEIGRAVGLPRVLGGIPLDEIGATGWGVAHAAEVAAPHAGVALSRARVAIQGVGAVGTHAARFLSERGATIVAASDSTGTLYDPEGLDVPALLALKRQGQSVLESPTGQKLECDAIVGIDCEVWIPAARPDVVREDNVSQLRARLVVEGANIPLTAGAEQQLHDRGVLVVPDFVANAGGVICAALEYQGAAESTVFPTIAERIRTNTDDVLTASARLLVSPRQAALQIAVDRVRSAMACRRWGIL